LLTKIEELGDELLEFVAPLWSAYRQEHTKSKKPLEGDKSLNATGTYTCVYILTFTKAFLLICGTAVHALLQTNQLVLNVKYVVLFARKQNLRMSGL
jgi:hypothetical protein